MPLAPEMTILLLEVWFETLNFFMYNILRVGLSAGLAFAIPQSAFFRVRRSLVPQAVAVAAAHRSCGDIHVLNLHVLSFFSVGICLDTVGTKKKDPPALLG